MSCAGSSRGHQDYEDKALPSRRVRGFQRVRRQDRISFCESRGQDKGRFHDGDSL